MNFGPKEINPLPDQEILSTLFENGFLQITVFVNSSKSYNDFTEQLVNCLLESYEANNKGVEGKRRILFIVADEFSLNKINEEFPLEKVKIWWEREDRIKKEIKAL
ncbi:hypothetical protein Glove_296g34 [Diversispora epigaea]|uniref:Uncharacterized protein n=1 Tax=Diversispora epigaea TaxID=1348612 RepID=A0A397HZP2_9GLOM|nr:hypothetical protein Glove_296g34 [Diversispora epigaea]